MQDHEVTITFETTYTIRRPGKEPAVFPMAKTLEHLDLVLFLTRAMALQGVGNAIIEHCQRNHEQELHAERAVFDARIYSELLRGGDEPDITDDIENIKHGLLRGH